MDTIASAGQPLTSTEKRRVWIGTVAALAVLVLAVALVFPYVRQISKLHFYRLSASSMEPTLYAGDHLAVDETYYAHHAIADGDIITFRHDSGTTFLAKRVLAIGGETIEGQHGQILRNGVVLTESYVHSHGLDDAIPEEEATFSKRTVPMDEVFVAGDWRERSLDSRASSYSPVHIGDVTGKVITVYWSSHEGQAGRRF